MFPFIVICIAVLFLSVVFTVVILSRKHKNTSAISGSNIRIDLSTLNRICGKLSDDKINFWIFRKSDYEKTKTRLGEGKPLRSVVHNRYKPVKIEYTDNKGVKTIRDIIPYRVNGYIISENEKYNEHEFYIEAFCLLRNEERSFHTNGISAAWYRGQGINLGDFLADLCRKTKDYKEAVRKRK